MKILLSVFHSAESHMSLLMKHTASLNGAIRSAPHISHSELFWKNYAYLSLQRSQPPPLLKFRPAVQRCSSAEKHTLTDRKATDRTYTMKYGKNIPKSRKRSA